MKPSRLIALALAGLTLGFAHAASFTAAWSRVVTLPTPSETEPTAVTGTFDKYGYTCKIRLPRYSALTVWTTGLEENTNLVASAAQSSSYKTSTWSASTRAKTSFTESKDTDGNYRFTLAPSNWATNENTYVTFYFQFKGEVGKSIQFNYQKAVVAQTIKVVGSEETPEEITPFETASPEVSYEDHTASCLTNGTYWYSMSLAHGLDYSFGVGTNSAADVRLSVYDAYGAAIDLRTLEPVPDWNSSVTNVHDEITCLTNLLDRVSVITTYELETNELVHVTNVYEYAEIYTNTIEGATVVLTNQISAVTNFSGEVVSVGTLRSVVTNYYREILSVQTNLTTVTNVEHVGICREAWRLNPPESGVYRFCFSGAASAAITFCEAVKVDYARVTFDPGEGSVSEAKRAYVAGLAYGSFPTATLDESDFVGWATDEDGLELVQTNDVASVGLTTFYAVWHKRPLLTVETVGDATGCKVTPATAATYAAGSVVTLTAVAGRKHHFLGWFADEALTALLSASTTATYTIPEASDDITIYARFATSADVLAETSVACEETYDFVPGVEFGPVAVTAVSPLETTLTASGLPSGLTFKNGVISGTPKKATKDAKATFTAKNSAGSVKKSVVFHCTNPGFAVSAIASGDDATIESGAELNLTVGVGYSLAFTATPNESDEDTFAATSFTVKGSLPSGLKFAKGVLSGTPTRVSDKSVKIIVSNRWGWSTTFDLTLHVSALPAWATGTFNGVGALGETNGLATVTVSATGRVSGSLQLGTKRYSFSVSSLAGFDGTTLEARPVLKIGRNSIPLALTVGAEAFDANGGQIGCVTATDDDGAVAIEAWQNVWSLKTLERPAYAANTTLAVGALLDLDDVVFAWKRKGTGVVTYAAERNGRKVSGSAQTLLLSQDADLTWSAVVPITSNGEVEQVAVRFTAAGEIELR